MDLMSSNRNIVLKVEEEEAGQRIDVFLSSKVPDISRNYVQKLIDDNCILVNGQRTKSKTKTYAGMEISVSIPKPQTLSIEPENIPLDIIYEDSDILIINKPKDMVVHPAPGNNDKTLVNALLYHCKDSLSDINGVIRPGIVHRIDKDTTGLIAVAKNNAAHQSLASQLKDHSMGRIYEAIVEGVISEKTGVIDAPIGRHPVDRKKMAVTPGKGKNAITHFEVLERLSGATHVRLRLETGRTHQIRVHMSYIHHAVYGDPLYAGSSKSKITSGQMLHARFLSLRHPSTGKIVQFEANLPEEFTNLLASLR
jgi:23S rRNA pseudouridine1911/1915/1917 synthase